MLYKILSALCFVLFITYKAQMEKCMLSNEKYTRTEKVKNSKSDRIFAKNEVTFVENEVFFSKKVLDYEKSKKEGFRDFELNLTGLYIFICMN